MRTALIVLAWLAAACSGRTEIRPSRQSRCAMKWIPSGEFTMGSNASYSMTNERPEHRVRVDGFWIDEHPVTNGQFARFVEATRYVTTAERTPDWEELKKQLPAGTPKPPRDVLVPDPRCLPAAWPSAPGQSRSVVAMDAGRELAASGRPSEFHRRSLEPSRRARFLGRCCRLCSVGGQTAADRSGVGIRGARWTRG